MTLRFLSFLALAFPLAACGNNSAGPPANDGGGADATTILPSNDASSDAGPADGAIDSPLDANDSSLDANDSSLDANDAGIDTRMSCATETCDLTLPGSDGWTRPACCVPAGDRGESALCADSPHLCFSVERGVALFCASAANCPGAQVCCHDGIGPGSFSCATSCGGRTQLCSSDAECGGATCVHLVCEGLAFGTCGDVDASDACAALR